MAVSLNNWRNNAVLHKLFSSIENKSDTNQRKLASELGISIGKVNYLLSEFISKGYIEVVETISNKKRACLYCLTPTGMVERAAIASRYLQSLLKLQKDTDSELEMLLVRQKTVNAEIEALKEETDKLGKAMQAGITKLRNKAPKVKPVAYESNKRVSACCG